MKSCSNLSCCELVCSQLAKKLKDCGVFGVSSDECLTYALQNRAEWEARGEGIVAELVAEVTETKTFSDENVFSDQIDV